MTKFLTAAQLLDPAILMLPMSFESWRLRTMILECGRRERVLDGKADPTPFEPWLVASPEEIKAWRKAHPSKVDGMAAATKRDFYGMKGVV